MNKKQKIIEKVREANPDLMKLEFGCKLRPKSEWLVDKITKTKWGDEDIVEDLYDFTVIDYQEGGSIGETGDYDCDRLFVEAYCMMGAYYTDLFSNDSFYDFCLDDIEIIGKPIQLQHVLIALEKCKSNISLAFGEFIKWSNGEYDMPKGTGIYYDLTKSFEINLEEKPELVELLWKILCE